MDIINKKTGGITKMKKIVSDLIINVVNKSLKQEANSACIFLGYQPKMPESVKKFRKESK